MDSGISFNTFNVGQVNYKRGISLHNHPESNLVKKAFTDEEMGEYKRRINELNILGQSDNVALYCKKITRK